MSEPIKVGDIVRVTGIGVGVLTETTIYDVEPLTHGTLTDIEAASVMLERAHHRIGELTRLLDAANGTPCEQVRHAEALAESEAENASLVIHVESMAMRIESLAGELAKPEDVRLREVLDALDGRAVIFDGLGARVGHLLDEMDEWIERAGATERRLEKALAEAQRERANERALVKPIGAAGPWNRPPFEPAREPNGYDPGARPSAEKAADPHAWAKLGVWAVRHDGQEWALGIRLAAPAGTLGRFWDGVNAEGQTVSADLTVRRPATPEETARFEAELARNTCDPMRPTCQQEGCEQCFPPKADPEPLKVGQRWVWWHGGNEHPLADDSIIVSIGDEIVTRTAGDHDPDTTRVEWTPVQFRKHHPRLRPPEELEPAPTPPAPQQATPPADPKTSLPGRGEP